MPNDVLTAAIDAVASGRDLTAAEAQEVLAEIMAGAVGEAQTAAFLIAMRTKGETVEELTGLARAMRRLAVPVEAGGGDLLDTAGTGGGISTFNVSTTAALVAAGAGCRVAKHGNRSATSLCGSADLLEALGARIDLDAAAVAQCVDEVGFGFMFAPAHHQAMKHVVPVRKDLGVRTIFNFLGPLTNPAGATRQLIGVSDPAYLEVIAGALVQLGARRAAVVASEGGMDEISVSGETRLLEVTPEGVTAHTVSPERVGLEPASHDEVKGGTPEQNAAIARAVLGGETGPRRTLVVLNAGAALFVADRVSSFEEGVRSAEQALDSGAALDAMESFVRKTRELAPEKEEAVGRPG
jgi:anthranilate phosphoribosyltransferase